MEPPRSPSPLPPAAILLDAPTEAQQLKQVPLPWAQLIPILLFRITDAVTYVVIFPLVTEMITSFHVPQDRIGLYAGVAEGSLMLVEAVCAPMWARAADKYGRRPCLIWGYIVCLIPSFMVGFSQSVPQVIFWRAALGLNPAAVCVRTIAGEISHPSNRAQLFAIFSPSFHIGAILGTLIGGELANPYGRLPAWMGGQTMFWKRWPYALPCVFSAAFGLLVTLLSWLTLPETKPESSGKKEKNMSSAIKASLKVPHFVHITGVFLIYQLVNFSWDGIFSVYTYTSAERGGLGLPVSIIGVLYALGSAAYVMAAPFMIPPIQSRFGGARGLTIVFSMWPLLALTIPVAQYFSIHNRFFMWITLGLQLFLKDVGMFSWPLSDALVVSLFQDTPELLATGSALNLIAGAGGRAIGPSVAGWIYSISTLFPTGSLGRQLSWLFFLFIAFWPALLSLRFPRDMGEHRDHKGYDAVPLSAAPDEDHSRALLFTEVEAHQGQGERRVDAV